jgi:hypothetical protein
MRIKISPKRIENGPNLQEGRQVIRQIGIWAVTEAS